MSEFFQSHFFSDDSLFYPKKTHTHEDIVTKSKQKLVYNGQLMWTTGNIVYFFSLRNGPGQKMKGGQKIDIKMFFNSPNNGSLLTKD